MISVTISDRQFEELEEQIKPLIERKAQGLFVLDDDYVVTDCNNKMIAKISTPFSDVPSTILSLDEQFAGKSKELCAAIAKELDKKAQEDKKEQFNNAFSVYSIQSNNPLARSPKPNQDSFAGFLQREQLQDQDAAKLITDLFYDLHLQIGGFSKAQIDRAHQAKSDGDSEDLQRDLKVQTKGPDSLLPVTAGATAHCFHVEKGSGKITVGNLGDSNSFAIFENEKGEVAMVEIGYPFDQDKKDCAAAIEAIGAEFNGPSGHIKKKGKNAPTVNCGGAIGDYGGRLLRKPEILQHDEQSLKASIPELAQYKMKGIIGVSDAYCKSSQEKWVPKNVRVFLAQKNDGGEIFFAESLKKSQFLIDLPIDAKNFVRYVESVWRMRDDNSAIFVDYEFAKQNGFFAIVSDGHSKGGEEISAKIISCCTKFLSQFFDLIKEYSLSKDRFLEAEEAPAQAAGSRSDGSLFGKMLRRFSSSKTSGSENEADFNGIELSSENLEQFWQNIVKIKSPFKVEFKGVKLEYKNDNFSIIEGANFIGKEKGKVNFSVGKSVNEISEANAQDKRKLCQTLQKIVDWHNEKNPANQTTLSVALGNAHAAHASATGLQISKTEGRESSEV